MTLLLCLSRSALSFFGFTAYVVRKIMCCKLHPQPATGGKKPPRSADSGFCGYTHSPPPPIDNLYNPNWRQLVPKPVNNFSIVLKLFEPCIFGPQMVQTQGNLLLKTDIIEQEIFRCNAIDCLLDKVTLWNHRTRKTTVVRSQRT